MSGTITKSKNLRIGYYAQHQVDVLDPSATPVEIITNSASRSTASSLRTEQENRDFLGGFHFQGSKADEAIGYFSGGEKTRLALAKVVSSKPNLLLLDEPTNHLDLEMCHALEMALQNYEGAMIIISHDRKFLNNICTHIADLDYGEIRLYPGNYDDFMLASTQARERLLENNRKKEAQIKELKSFIQRFSANASKAKQATSRANQISKIQLDDCLLYTSPSPRDATLSRMPSSA